MRKWIYDNPWIWVALFLSLVVAGSVVVVTIAELNKPEIVKEKHISTLGGEQTRAGLVRWTAIKLFV